MKYFDFAATTPVDRKVLKAMFPYLKGKFGNPSSAHQYGLEAKKAVDKARKQIAIFLNCKEKAITFTGSATEADNLALKGIIKGSNKKNPHIVTTEIEHHAILHTCKELEKEGIEVTYLPVDKNGFIKPSEVKEAIQENTILVSIMYANNEIGTIEPVQEIGEYLQTLDRVYFHTDAVQAVNYLDCDVKKLGVDLMTISAHKIYGPKGVGALYVNEEIPIDPIIYGGGQEMGLRSGTENVPGIVGLGKAIEIINKNQKKAAKKIKKMREEIINKIMNEIPNVKLNGPRKDRLANNINFSFKNIDGEGVIIALDQKDIAVSTGSACSAQNLKASHVLRAIGLDNIDAHGSVRITLGRFNKEDDIIFLIESLKTVVKKLREISSSI